MLGLVFDIISFLRFGYIVLCMIVGIGVVVGFCVKVIRFCIRVVNNLLMIRRTHKIKAKLEKLFGKKWIDELNKSTYQSKTDEADDRSSRLYFAVDRAGQHGYIGRPINIDKGGKHE